MGLNRIDGDLLVTGNVIAGRFTPPVGSIGDTQMNAADPIGTDKARHLHAKVFSQPDAGSPYDEIRCVHVALSPGTVEQFQVGLRVAITGNSTILVNLKKNGVTILSSVPNLDNTFLAYVQSVAGINPTLANYVVGDVFEVTVTVTDGTGTPGEGLFAQVAFNEGAF